MTYWQKVKIFWFWHSDTHQTFLMYTCSTAKSLDPGPHTRYWISSTLLTHLSFENQWASDFSCLLLNLCPDLHSTTCSVVFWETAFELTHPALFGSPAALQFHDTLSISTVLLSEQGMKQLLGTSVSFSPYSLVDPTNAGMKPDTGLTETKLKDFFPLK